MLQQILKDMYIDPDVLDALSEDQKKTLFLKMRQEQVRRWKEREEKAEREGGLGEPPRIRPKRANAKSVTWKLGRDGDIAVIVIGEVDEFKTSKIICSGFGEKKLPVLHNSASQSGAGLKSNLVQRTTPDAARTGRENLPPKTQHTALPSTKEGSEEVSALPPLQSELNPGSAPGEKPLPPAATICHPAARTAVITVRAASALAAQGVAKASAANANHFTVETDPDPDPTPMTPLAAAASAAAATAAAAHSPVPIAAPRACYQLLKPQQAAAQEPRHRDDNHVVDTAPAAAAAAGSAPAAAAAAAGSAPAVAAAPAAAPAGTTACAGRGRVAQLMKTFNAESPSTPGAAATGARSPKPPLPSKPSHLRLLKSSTVR